MHHEKNRRTAGFLGCDPIQGNIASIRKEKCLTLELVGEERLDDVIDRLKEGMREVGSRSVSVGGLDRWRNKGGCFFPEDLR